MFRRIWLPLEAAANLTWARHQVRRCSSVEILQRLLDGQPSDADTGASERETEWLRDLAWALNGVARRLPWRADCLIRVLAAQNMVRGRGLIPTIGLQAGKTPERGFEAHAWLRVGGIEVSGGPSPRLKEMPTRSQYRS